MEALVQHSAWALAEDCLTEELSSTLSSQAPNRNTLRRGGSSRAAKNIHPCSFSASDAPRFLDDLGAKFAQTCGGPTRLGG